MAFDYDSYSNKLTRPRKFRFLLVLEALLERFSAGERLLLYILSVAIALSTLAMVASLNAAASVDVPAHAGTLTEGEIGPARFINPLLAASQADQDLTLLVYSGLMRAKSDGTYIPDLASSYQISSDGTTYTFRLRPNAVFQDGKPVTAADILYTVSLAQNTEIKSPRRVDWEGVAVSSPDPKTVVFKLPHAYAPFIDNATLGILPKHVWQNVKPEEFPFNPANTRPVGSGPFRVANVATDSTGAPTRYDLTPFDKFTLGEPYLKRISFVFYPNESSMINAWNAGKIDAVAAVNPEDLPDLKKAGEILKSPLPRVFGIFFDQGHNPVLADASVRAALDAALDKQAIVNVALRGQGAVLEGPIPPGLGNPAPAVRQTIAAAAVGTSATSSLGVHTQNAQAILQRGGWKLDNGTWKKGKLSLSFTLATANEPELVAAANAAAAQWHAAGITAAVQVYPLSDLNTSVIRPRSYDALLFGEVVGRTGDLFAFWHSSQRNDPGLNLAMYANAKADTLLAQVRSESDEEARQKLYQQFASIVRTDAPAVFLFSPYFLYVVPPTLRGIELGALTNPAERFLNAYEWYSGTERVWSIFSNS